MHNGRRSARGVDLETTPRQVTPGQGRLTSPTPHPHLTLTPALAIADARHQRGAHRGREASNAAWHTTKSPSPSALGEGLG